MMSAGARVAQTEVDRRKAVELMAEYPEWRIWSSNEGTRYATRKGVNPQPPTPDDENWARTVCGDNWDDLTTQLAGQYAGGAS